MERWDEHAFQIRDEAEEAGDLTGGLDYGDAFAKARAAGSPEAALMGDVPRAVYEARYALDNDEQLLSLVAELTGRSLLE